MNQDKICAICGGSVKQGAISCPNCGSGIFETDKTHRQSPQSQLSSEGSNQNDVNRDFEKTRNIEFPITAVNHSVIYDKDDSAVHKFVQSSTISNLPIGDPKRYEQMYFGESVGAVEHIIVGKKQIISQDISYIKENIGILLLDIQQSKKISRLLGIIIQGYAEDPKPLWEIRKVKAWYKKLHNSFAPYLSYLLHPLDIWVYVAMFVKTERLDANNSKLKNSSVASFLLSVYDVGNRFCQKISENNSQAAQTMIDEATKRIQYSLFEKNKR